MTIQRWNDDRLDRLADRVEDSFRAIEVRKSIISLT